MNNGVMGEILEYSTSEAKLPSSKQVKLAAQSLGLEEQSAAVNHQHQKEGTDRVTYWVALATLFGLSYLLIWGQGAYTMEQHLLQSGMSLKGRELADVVSLVIISMSFIGLSISRLLNVGYRWYWVGVGLCPGWNLWLIWLLFSCPFNYRFDKSLGVSGIINSVVCALILGGGSFWFWNAITQAS